MKYNDNGEYKDIYVKAFDTLPIGTEVDYDGSVVPSGWEQITNKSDILWTNPNITNAFNGQTINVDLSDYDSYEIISLNSLYISNATAQSTGIIPKNRGTFIFYPNLRYLGYRAVTIGNNSITFGNYDFYPTYGNSTTQTENNFGVPLYIIGYKTGLYS